MHGEELVYALKERLLEINRDASFYEYMCVLVELKKQMELREVYLKEHENEEKLDSDVKYSSNLLAQEQKLSFWDKFINFFKNIFKKKEKKVEKQEEKKVAEKPVVKAEVDDYLPDVDINVDNVNNKEIDIEITDYSEDKIISTYNEIKEEEMNKENETIKLHEEAVKAELENEIVNEKK